ncbi:hypothetical protein, partial [Xanthomonas vasicola]|uniref:hypothetical protein n=1 Tax=Xanthomonas vasicola TaxID=56459 RepID=UPI001C96B3B0
CVCVIVAGSRGVVQSFPKVDGGGWGWQRPLVNGWHEDVDNPTLASTLATYLRTRSTEAVVFPRSTSETVETSTKLPWWKLAAKYHLARILPKDGLINATGKRSNRIRRA